ncbi:hypothetical protein TIFTF001_020602 [Ficus carica]|uniref:Uncharacterized protein n=1 Tax=Ficus carica TaxID=3494 RepID=A0AA88DJM5_FICCA|nr:hypothetical protein TIFTF001_020602 [Ficus carica]
MGKKDIPIFDESGPEVRPICKMKDAFEKLTRWNCHAFTLLLMNIKSIIVPTLEEQKANHKKGFVPYHDDPDAIVDNWATILESGTSIFWEDLLHADLEGRRNFLHGYAEQTRSLLSNPSVDESIPPQDSSHADNSMQQLETWKGGDRGESSGGGGEHSRGVDVRINGGGDIETQNVIYAPTAAVTTIGGVV